MARQEDNHYLTLVEPDVQHVPPEDDPAVQFWYSPESEPLTVPQSVAIDRAIYATANNFRGEGLEVSDVLDPTTSQAKAAHYLLLTVLNDTSIEQSVLAPHLGYARSDSAWHAMHDAVEAVRAFPDLSNRYDIIRGRYKQALNKYLGEQAVAERTQELDVKRYVREIKRFERAQEQKPRRRMPPDPQADMIVERAVAHMEASFEGVTPVTRLLRRVRAHKRERIRERLRRSYPKLLQKHLHASRLMYNQGLKAFEAMQLPNGQLAEFVAETLQDAARLEINKVLARQLETTD